MRMKISEFAEMIGITKNAIYVPASSYRDKTGQDPKWLIRDGKDVFIDTIEFDKRSNRIRECKRHATSPDIGIYWYLNNYVSDYVLAKKLAYYTPHRSAGTWAVFLSNGAMWREEEESRVVTRTDKTMIEEFIQYGTWILYSLAKNHGIREHEFEDVA